MRRKKKPDLETFLQENSHVVTRPGRTCDTCKFDRVAELNEACLTFVKKREAGFRMKWTSFFDLYLVGQLGYTVGYPSLKRHLRSCMGLKELHL